MHQQAVRVVISESPVAWVVVVDAFLPVLPSRCWELAQSGCTPFSTGTKWASLQQGRTNFTIAIQNYAEVFAVVHTHSGDSCNPCFSLKVSSGPRENHLKMSRTSDNYPTVGLHSRSTLCMSVLLKPRIWCKPCSRLSFSKTVTALGRESLVKVLWSSAIIH